MKIIITDKIDFTDKQEARLRKLADLEIYNDIPKEEGEIIKRVEGAEIITTNWIEITENVIRKTPTLSNIIVSAVGYDKVDIEAASREGIKISNSPTFCVNAVAEHTFALLLDLLRMVTVSNNELKSGLWKKTDFLGTELRGKILGIIGYGKIGHVVSEIATGFGMTVKTVDSKSSKVEINNVFSTSDIISIHVPQNPHTAHLISRDRLRLMKKDAVLVNTARGPVVDQEALYDCLQDGIIAGAALDVFEDEPTDGSVGESILKLVKLPNVLATPHIAFNTKEAIYKIGEEVIENITAAVKGDPINVVN